MMFFLKSSIRKTLALLMASGMAVSVMPGFAALAAERPMLDVSSDAGVISYLGSYWTGETNADGAVAEIVQYNPDNKKMYIVSGTLGALDIVSISGITENGKAELKLEKRINISELGTKEGFVCGDMTSVAVNSVRDFIAIATQDSDLGKNGAIVLLNYDGEYITHFEAGVQPDMIAVSPYGDYVLTANEGEPREGYAGGAVDPKGSVTVVNLNNNEVKTVDFSEFDAKREELLADKVLINPTALPSADFEPEYISISEDNTTAYISLQESNAIATFNIADGKWVSVKGLGFKDYSKAGNELDFNVNGEILPQNENVFGVYMPDSIATVNIDGKQYVLTANEGDAREWGDYANIDSKEINGSGKKVEFIKNEELDGLNPADTYLLGGRSFSIRNAEDMSLVYDSGSDFERITGRIFPEYFNSGHDEPELEGRSNKKGPEPEEVKTAVFGDRTFAFIALERMGGVMMYDISDPAEAKYIDYLNVRDFSSAALDNGSDLGAEGICVIRGENSPTGKPLLLVANEISGSVTIMQLELDKIQD